MIKRMIIMLILVGLIFGGIFGFQVFKGKMMMKYMASMGAPAQTVSTIAVTASAWEPGVDVVGSLRAAQGVDLAAEVAGVVDEIHFDSGSDVKAGELLVKLRTADDVARLQSLEAAAKLAERTYERDMRQLKANAVSQAAVDTAVANVSVTKAQVLEQQALIDKKSIRAPFAGHLGIRAVDLGQYLNAGAPIVTLQNLDHLYFDFTLPQQMIAQLKTGQAVKLMNDTYPGRVFAAQIFAINPKVEPTTRNVQVRAILANADHALLPGMFATGRISLGEKQNLLTLPQTAITYNPYGDTVYVVQDKGKNDKGEDQLVAMPKFVKIGEKRGDQVAIKDGLSEGDVVVTSGQMKLQKGSPIVVNNKIIPANEADPRPQEQ